MIGADDPVGPAGQQDFHGGVAHTGGHDPVPGGRRAAALDVAQDGHAGIEAQLLMDAVADLHGLAGALGDDDHVVGLAGEAGPADLFHHVPVEVHGQLGHQHGGRAHGQAHVESQMAGVAAHDLHDGAALVGLHGVPQTVDGVHGGIGGGVEADGVVGADDVVVDGGGDADHGHAGLGQRLCAPEGAVAADGHDAVQTQKLAGGGSPLLACLGAEFVAAGGVEDGAASIDDMGDGAGVHTDDIAVDKAVVAAADADALDAAVQAVADYGADGGVHTRGVTAAGEDANAFHRMVHGQTPRYQLI